MPAHEASFGEQYVTCTCGKWKARIADFETEWPKHLDSVPKCPPGTHVWELAVVDDDFAYYGCRNCSAQKMEPR